MNYLPPRRSDGTNQDRRIQNAWPSDKPFKILSIDGGGICGILPAALLAEFEKRYLEGQPIGHHFDMIAGTSTGGILALGLGQGISAQEILEMYLTHGISIFPPMNKLQKLIHGARRFVRYSYDPRALKTALQKTFQQSVLASSKNRLCIPSFEGVYGEPWIYKTPHHADYQKDQHAFLVDIGLATSAAPTFFPAVENNGYVMVDGGIWANNPIMIAVTDTLSCFEVRRENVHVLSLGCGTSSFQVTRQKATGGMWQWKDAIKAAMRAQSHNALGQSYLLLGKPNVVRLDAPDGTGGIELDDYRRASAELPALARTLAESSGQFVLERFLKEQSVFA